MATDKYAEIPLDDRSDGKPKEDEGVRLKPKMGLLNGVSVIVGSIIGSGIFISPSGVLVGTGSTGLALSVWVMCGVFSTMGAYCYAELGCMIRKSGADYAYIMDTFGSFMAFMRLWVECMVVRPCLQTVVSLTFSIYALKPFFPSCDPPDESVRILAAAAICLLTFVNCFDVKWATRVQDLTTYAKLTALVIIIITGLVMLCFGHTENFNFQNTETDVTKIALSFYSGLFAYTGWNYLNFVIEELKDPVRNLPIAIAISCTIVTLVYTMTNVAFHTTLTNQEILGSNAVALSFGERLYGPGVVLVPIFVALSTFGTVNGILLTSSRLFYAGAREGQMPEILTMIQINKLTPSPAVIFMALLSLLYLSSSDVFALITYAGFATWLSIGFGVLCLPVLRYTQPSLKRPIKVNLAFPIVYLLMTILLIVMSTVQKPKETGFGAVMILTGVPVYFLFIYWKRKPVAFQKAVGKVTIFLQRILVVLPADDGDSSK